MDVRGEKVKQTCWCFSSSSRAMAPVQKESRNLKMLNNAGEFHKKLSICEKRFTNLSKSTDGILGAIDDLLSSLQPGVYDNNAEGGSSVVPGSNSAHMPPGQMHRASAVQLKSTVLDPIAEWQADYLRIKGALPLLGISKTYLRTLLTRTEMRLQAHWPKQVHASLLVDKYRRAYYHTTSKHLRENVLKTDGVNVPIPAREEDNDLQKASATHDKIEADLHAELVALAEKAKQVEVHLSGGLRLEANALKAASEKIHPTIDEGLK